jgi:hypothetical protein
MPDPLRNAGECPHCGMPLAYMANGEEYSHAILMEIQGVYDGGLFYQCPKCEGRWHRWPEGSRLRARAEYYVRTVTSPLSPSSSASASSSLNPEASLEEQSSPEPDPYLGSSATSVPRADSDPYQA